MRVYNLLGESAAPKTLTIWGGGTSLRDGYAQFLVDYPNTAVVFGDTPDLHDLALAWIIWKPAPRLKP